MRYLLESSRVGKIYGSSKLSATLLVHTLTINRCCIARGRLLVDYLSLDVHIVCMNTPSDEKVDSLQNNMELAKCMSAANHCANVTRRG